MPELPEVQRAVNLIKRVGLGKRVQGVQTTEDALVFADITHTEFAGELQGRTIKDVQRYGKQFYLVLDGKGRLPVLHFGMTGILQVRGENPLFYKEAPRKNPSEWPPRFMKFILHLVSPDTNPQDPQIVTELAFSDPRRLGRIRLRDSPKTEPPISTLGFDPILSMPSLENFIPMVSKRSCPIKALLLDQSFSAGVGNWVADEILYHSRVHPEQRCNTLNTTQLNTLHHQIKDVCQTAVSVDADDTKFPENWLFKHRWGKGKKTKSSLKLPSGEPATIKFITVGGRTSAYVSELQKHTVNNDEQQPFESESPSKKSTHGKRKVKPTVDEDNEGESDLTALSDEGLTPLPKRKRKMVKTKAIEESTEIEIEGGSSSTRLLRSRTKRRQVD